MKIGFLAAYPSRILGEAYQHLRNRSATMYPGEGSAFLDLINEIHNYQEQFPDLEVPQLSGGGDSSSSDVSNRHGIESN